MLNVKTDDDKLAKMLEKCLCRYKPKSRVYLTFHLASLYIRKGKAAFVYNAQFVGLTNDEIAAALVILESK